MDKLKNIFVVIFITVSLSGNFVCSNLYILVLINKLNSTFLNKVNFYFKLIFSGSICSEIHLILIITYCQWRSQGDSNEFPSVKKNKSALLRPCFGPLPTGTFTCKRFRPKIFDQSKDITYK